MPPSLPPPTHTLPMHTRMHACMHASLPPTHMHSLPMHARMHACMPPSAHARALSAAQALREAQHQLSLWQGVPHALQGLGAEELELMVRQAEAALSRMRAAHMQVRR